jgi:transposase
LKGHLLMSRKELERKKYLEEVVKKQLRAREMAEILKLSYRQVIRIVGRYRAEGDKGLVHRNRGKASNRAKPDTVREAILSRYQERYDTFGPTFASEKLTEEGKKIDHETLRRWLMKEGMWQRQRKKGRHRQRRERRGHFGELVQMDGSHHAWWGEEKGCLLNMIDDATSRRLGVMAKEETTEAALEALWAWVDKYGIPRALYVDRKNVYWTDEASSQDKEGDWEGRMTAFGRACHKLGITIIPSYCPQGKGRVERAHGTDQDRLVKELQLAGIQDFKRANAFLKKKYYPEINQKFSVAAADPVDYHRPVPADMKLEEVFCWEESRQVQKDWTVRFQNQFWQILRQNTRLPRPGQKVIMRRLLSGKLQILYQGERLQYKLFTPPLPQPQFKSANPWAASGRRKPSDNHPWRKGLLRAGSRESIASG